MGGRLTDVVLRELHFGRVWRANVCRLVEERDGLVALWSPRGVARKLPLGRGRNEIRIPPDWRLGWDYVDDKLDLVVEASGEWRLDRLTRSSTTSRASDCPRRAGAPRAASPRNTLSRGTKRGR